MCHEDQWLRSEIILQFFYGYVCLFQNGLQRLWFEFPVHRHTGMQSVFGVMAMRSGLPHELKAQSFQCAAHFIAGKVARQLHAICADSTGSCKKCSRIGQCRRSSFSANRHWTKSRIIASSSSRVSPCVAISGSWQVATSILSSCSTSKMNSFFIATLYAKAVSFAKMEIPASATTIIGFKVHGEPASRF